MPFLNNTSLAVLLFVVIILFIITGRLADPSRTLVKKRPPVELAKDPSTKGPLLDSLKWDFAFIPIYTIGVVLLCFIAGRAGAKFCPVLYRITSWIIVVVIATAFIDVAENIALKKVSNPSSNKTWESIARFCGFGKYFSPFLGSLYSFGVGIWCLLKIGSR